MAIAYRVRMYTKTLKSAINGTEAEALLKAPLNRTDLPPFENVTANFPAKDAAFYIFRFLSVHVRKPPTYFSACLSLCMCARMRS